MIRTRGYQAFYNPKLDLISMPDRELFISSEHYYATKFHEIGHSTGHPSRLNRITIESYKHDKYTKEELVAELFSSYICALVNIEKITIENSAAYLNFWLKKLKNEPKMFIQASQRAQKAVQYFFTFVQKRNSTTTTTLRIIDFL
jgi:antirestriction protein ArdC